MSRCFLIMTVYKQCSKSLCLCSLLSVSTLFIHVLSSSNNHSTNALPKQKKSHIIFLFIPGSSQKYYLNTQQHLNSSISSVQSISIVWLFATPRTAECQASPTITNSWSLLKLMSIALVIPSNHLILCHPLLLLPSVFPSIRVFSNESVLRIRWAKYRSFSFQWIFWTDFL